MRMALSAPTRSWSSVAAGEEPGPVVVHGQHVDARVDGPEAVDVVDDPDVLPRPRVAQRPVEAGGVPKRIGDQAGDVGAASPLPAAVGRVTATTKPTSSSPRATKPSGGTIETRPRSVIARRSAPRRPATSRHGHDRHRVRHRVTHPGSSGACSAARRPNRAPAPGRLAGAGRATAGSTAATSGRGAGRSGGHVEDVAHQPDAVDGVGLRLGQVGGDVVEPGQQDEDLAGQVAVRPGGQDGHLLLGPRRCSRARTASPNSRDRRWPGSRRSA